MQKLKLEIPIKVLYISKIALKKLNCETNKVWMIGDNATSDMIGAEKIGIKKIQKLHEGVKIIEKGEGKPDLIFRNYVELTKLIKNNV